MEALAAGAGVGLVADFFASAGAGEGEGAGEEGIERGAVVGGAGALVEDRAIPGEAEGFERGEDGVGGAGDAAGGIDVFHAEEPLAVVGAGVEVTGNGGDEGAEVERARRRWGETADVRGGSGMVGAHRLELWTSCL